MKILCIGGGPAGLYFALLMKLRNPDNDIVVVERNRPYDTFGWGVVFSDATLQNLREADPVSSSAIVDEFSRWDDIDIHYGGRVIRSGGHGFIGIGRKKLLNILQARCEELDVRLIFETNVEDDQALARIYGADLVIASDGVNSAVRTRYADVFRPSVDLRHCRFIWLGTTKVFDAFNFIFVPTEHGWFQAHAYRFENGLSTFIVETTEATWKAIGIDQWSHEEGIAYCERLFAPWLDGHPLLSNAAHLRGSALWIRFPRVICEQWVHWSGNAPIVLMGDAAHTAHFSIGSGTKLALEDAIELARCLTDGSGASASAHGGASAGGGSNAVAIAVAVASAGSGGRASAEGGASVGRGARAGADELRGSLARYQAVRSVEVLKIQNAARNSTEWFENVARYARLEPEQFAYSLLTRSQRISHENLRQRDRRWLENHERWIAQRAGVGTPGVAMRAAAKDSAAQNVSAQVEATFDAARNMAAQASAEHHQEARPPLPMLTPYRIRGLTLKNRVVVSPTLLYSCVDGRPGAFHLVHLGSRALGGAGLILVEMTAVSADARVTPACPGLWNDEQREAFREITRFVHENSGAKIGIQLGHAGRRGSTQLGWERPDHPLSQGNWPLLSASAIPFRPGLSQVPAQVSRAQMNRIHEDFTAATRRAVEAGFDWIELQAGHGYLLSSFLSPLSNTRDDSYGGPLENRLRFPLEIMAAMREACPDSLPLSVRISANDWAPGGTSPEDAVTMSRRFHAAGADMIDCSSGEVVAEQKPVYGRLYQTPLADRIRNEAGVPTIAVGAISEADQVNGIIASGRADLCALSRPHLADSAWVLRETARLGVRDVEWPAPYRWGRDVLERSFVSTAKETIHG